MRRYIRYLSAFCCGLIATLFLIPVMATTPVDSAGLKQSSKNQPVGVTTIAVSPDGQTLATGTADSQITLFDVGTGREKLSLKNPNRLPVTKVAFSPTGDKLASVSRDTVLRIWDTKEGKQIRALTGHENPTRAVAYSPKGKIIASGGEDSAIALWDEEKLLRILQGHRNFVNDLAFSPDGTTLASGAEDRRIILWDVASGKQGFVLRGHADGVTSVAFNPKGRILASGSKDGTVRLWDLSTGTQRQILGVIKGVNTVAFSPNGKFLAAGGEDDSVLLFDVDSGKLNKRIAKNKTSRTNTVIFNPANDNSLVTADEDGEVSLVDVEKGQKNNSIKVPVKDTKQAYSKALKSDNLPQKTTTTISSSKENLLAAIPSPPGGPILIVTSTNNPFSEYYAEILRNEGLNYFNVTDISSITSATLNSYDVVILTEMPLTSAQVTTFSNWVNSGGNLIAMRPDKQLANLFGLADAGSTLSDGYLLIDTSEFPGNGLVNETIQFHGVSDRYALNGASIIARLYNNSTTQTSNPGVTIRNFGSGKAAAFTFDLARSVVYTRQGNPAWEAQERDSFSPIRSDDQFYGAASFDPKSDWIDLNKVAIPQADEQQRLLANMIVTMNASKKPLPRFWYFPNGKKAVVLMTGDDHGNNGTPGRFDQYVQQSPAGCNVDNWECIRGTSYVYPNTPISNAQAAAYNGQGFEISLHLDTNCNNFTTSSLSSFYDTQLAQFSQSYPSLPAPATQRHHCGVWSEWSSTPEVQLTKGIRLDTNYYYWPPIWVLDRPGFFTGSGMPMRFAKKDGTIIDVYGATTQLTDESGQSYPYTITTLLDRAVGSEAYYGVLNVNAHTDYNGGLSQSISDNVVSAAKARGVPVVSGRQLLTWLDGRNSSSFNSLSWNSSNSQLSFSITKGTGTTGLQTLLPTRYADQTLSSITRNGSQVTYTTTGTKGIDYAIFPGDAGSYVATYAPSAPPTLEPISPPSPSPTFPDNNAASVSVGSSLVAKFNQAMDPGTINSSSFELRDSANTLVAGKITYDATTRTTKLEPNGNLALNTTYTATLKGGAVKNQAGNALAADYTWSFSTAGLPCPQQQPCQIWNNSTTPGNTSVNDPNGVELGVKFKSDLDGFITGLRFYKGSQNTGTHVGTLWNINGQQLARATFSNESASGWQQVNFSTPVPITANTVYIASYHAPNGGYAGDLNFFNSDVNSPPLQALSNNTSAGNGLYRYNSTPIFPDSTYLSSNYWVDVVFTTSTPAQIPPTVTSTTPGDTTTGISTGTTITANFSKSMNSATINTSNFELRGPSNAVVAANVTYNAANNTATLTPNATLAPNTNYTVTIKGGSSGVKDQAGNAMSQDSVWTFTAGSGITIWDNTASPAILADTDTQAVELGVKFRSDVNGYVKGIRYYKSTSNTGTHTGTLWSISGQQLATATFANETASGWQEVNFSTPVAITANTDYVASYHTNVGRYSKTENFFANSGVNRPPLLALQNGVNGSNGVYTYSSTTPVFPTSTYLSTNYWVDVIFSTTP